jgi:surface polysaccharide O-acyltransferase-like enzyme
MNNKAQMDYFWRKKEFVTFILSILVFLIHISSFAPYMDGDTEIAVFNGKLYFFFHESITRFAVPMYFILSGITLFRDYTNQKYVSKLKSRFVTLCVPYLIWNTVWMLFNLICTYTFISSYYTGREPYTLSVGNVFKGIFLYGANLQFWYIFYLIVFIVLSPLFDLLVRNKYVGIVMTVLLAILSVVKMDFQYNAIVFYMLGALLGKHYFADVTKKTNRASQICSVSFLLVYVLLKNLFPTNEYYMLPFVKIIVFALAAYALWSALDLFFDKLKPRSIYARSFAIYAMHVNVAAIIYKLCYLILPKNGYMAIPNFVITLSLTIIVINVFCIVFERYLPSVYALLMGKGIKKQCI